MDSRFRFDNTQALELLQQWLSFAFCPFKGLFRMTFSFDHLDSFWPMAMHIDKCTGGSIRHESVMFDPTWCWKGRDLY